MVKSSDLRKLFYWARQAGIGDEDLRAGAAEITGVSSLRSLTPAQVRSYAAKLRAACQRQRAERVQAIASQFENTQLSPAQRDYMVDLVADCFGNMGQFRSWLSHYFTEGQPTHERFISAGKAPAIIKALTDMRIRGFKACKR